MIRKKFHKFYSALTFLFLILGLPLAADEKAGSQQNYFQANPIIAEIDGEIHAINAEVVAEADAKVRAGQNFA